MAQATGLLARPAPGADPRAPSKPRTAGFAVALIGLMLVAITAFGNAIIAGALPDEALGLTWTFGLGTTGLGIVKIAVAVVLVGIISRLWVRVDSVKTALSALAPRGTSPATRSAGSETTPFGTADISANVPKPLLIHRMARTMWLPVLAMGAMILVAGAILSLLASGQVDGSGTFRELFAWAQGTLFLGEGLLLAGISFLLGTILAGLREGGGEAQASLGAPVKTLRMPTGAKAFIALMMIGTMLAMLQFVLYILVATSSSDASSFAIWSAWLGPLREVALGLLLSGIVLALYTVSQVLGFQFARIRQLLTEGV